MKPISDTDAPALADTLTVRVVASLRDLDPAAWDACAALPDAGPEGGDSDNPFLRHAFLSALEESGSATAKTGWAGAHLLVEDEAGALLAAAPCYLKSHSQGEYVFDHAFADAYARAGGRYYPKLQVCVPFTPATGPRLLVRAGDGAEAARGMLVAGLQELRVQTGSSSVNLTFLPREDWERLGEQGFLQRTDQQFHWINEGYATFDDFLAALASRKRKVLKRERRDALQNGVTVEWLTGADLTESVWDTFFGFYMDTGDRKWGRPYLTRKFFSLVGERMPERILLIVARREGRIIAGALNFIGASTLYGRHWGCVEEHPFLHFEVCYYQAIDFALSRGLARVEAGAQGGHKLVRGYRPVLTYSAHDIADPALRRAVADYLKRERAHVEAAREELEEATPFRKGEADE